MDEHTGNARQRNGARCLLFSFRSPAPFEEEGYEITIFESIRSEVTARDAAERYGIEVKRNGMACCPFHDDKTPSMKLDRRFHCFGCGADGDAVSFTGRLFDLSPLEAAKKLAEDFGIPYSDTGSRPTSENRAGRRELSEQERARKLEKDMRRWLSHAVDILIRYRKLLASWERDYRPKRTDEDWHPLFCEALSRKDRIDYLLDILQAGDDTELLSFFRVCRKEVREIERTIRKYEQGRTCGTGEQSAGGVCR